MWKKFAVLVCGAALSVTLAPAVAQAAPAATTVQAAVPHAVVAAAPSRATLAAAVKAVTYERVFGSKYGYYKARYPRAIDWNNDGCSVPAAVKNIKGVRWVLSHYSGVFEKSCDRHDFGYRNYGKHAGGLALDSTADRRKSIDDRFHSNMDYQCLQRYDDWYDVPARAACYKASDIFYGAVRAGGGGSFY